MSPSARGGRSLVRSRRSVLGAAFIARGLAGNPSRDPATGRRKSPGLFGSILLVLFGGVFLGVGIYVHNHSASLRSQPGTKGSPVVMGWICIALGGLVVLIGGMTLLNRIVCLLIGIVLLAIGAFERPEPTPAGPSGGAVFAPPTGPAPAAAPPSTTAPASTGWPAPTAGPTPMPAPAQFSPHAGGGDSAPLLPPPFDPRLPGASG